jgi:multidrug resistance efflux pump
VSIGWGVAQGQGSAPGELPTAPAETSWAREARRFPVRIQVLENPLALGVRVGSQATVIVYTGDNPILNALGRLRIRLTSILTYVY